MFLTMIPPQISILTFILVPVMVIGISIIHARFLIKANENSSDPKTTFFEFYPEKESGAMKMKKISAFDFTFRFTQINVFYFLIFRYLVSTANYLHKSGWF